MTSTTEVQRTIHFPPQGDWALDPDHTVAGFVGRYLMLTKVPGKFNGVSGMIHIANDPEESWVEVSLETASITTDHDDRDKHLKSLDFLDVGNYPTIDFRSTGFDSAGKHWTVPGDLTIKGETRPIILDVEYHGVVSDPWGGSADRLQCRHGNQPRGLGIDMERRPRSRRSVGGPESQARNRDTGSASGRQIGVTPVPPLAVARTG